MERDSIAAAHGVSPEQRTAPPPYEFNKPTRNPRLPGLLITVAFGRAAREIVEIADHPVSGCSSPGVQVRLRRPIPSTRDSSPRPPGEKARKDPLPERGEGCWVSAGAVGGAAFSGSAGPSADPPFRQPFFGPKHWPRRHRPRRSTRPLGGIGLAVGDGDLRRHGPQKGLRDRRDLALAVGQHRTSGPW